ncbi:MAG: FadR family transcriptional regulator [Actinomycetota bacterium]|nr:FadR family transcriptional regulator [Actinomycetota bacterium]
MAKRSQIIVDDYLRRIVSGEMSVGELLPTESALIEIYGISRTAVREAIQTLATKGFVQIRQGSGSTVAPQASWNVLDPSYLGLTGLEHAIFQNLLEVQDIFEPAAAGLAAQRASAQEVAALRDLIDQLSAAGHRDPGRHAELDFAFHHKIAECAQNPVLISLYGSIMHIGRAQRQTMAGSAEAVERAVFWHTHITDAIDRHDALAAQDAMRMHLRQVHSDLEALVEQPVTAS